MSISEPMMGLRGWVYLVNAKSFTLALPGIVAAIALVWVSRNAKTEAILPITMAIFPVIFYILLYAMGSSMDGARSFDELGRLSTPPMTKDAVAGRIRRLLATADKRAAELGIPDTESAISDYI